MKKFKKKYDTVDIRRRKPKGSVHITKKDYKPIQIKKVCEDLGVDYAEALVDFQNRGYGHKRPLTNGVLVWSSDYLLVAAEIKRRKEQLKKRTQLIPQRDHRFDDKYRSKAEALSDAARAMCELVRYCKNERCKDRERIAILEVEMRFSHSLYANGYCLDVGLAYEYNEEASSDQAEQGHIECWRCGGSGCGHCLYTGYCDLRSDCYYIFHYKVGDMEFFLCLPKKAVKYPVDISKTKSETPGIAIEPLDLEGMRFQKMKKIALLNWVMSGMEQNKK